MKNNIWIINQYCGSKFHGMNFRSWYFAKELKKKGYNPHIISASYSHLFYKLPVTKGKFTLEDVDGIPFTWVKVSKYKGSQSIGRVLVMIQFMLNLFFLPKKMLQNPDVIIVSSLSPLPIINAYLWSIKYKAKLIFEVRDIWPLSLIEIGGFSKLNPLVLFFGWFEKFAYKKADKVISLLPNAKPHMESRGMEKDKFVHIPNGFNLEEMKKSKELDKSISNSIPKDKFIVGYTGSLGASNAMEYLIEASNHLENNENIHFVIFGKGQHLEKLKNNAKNNVSFFGQIDKSEIQSAISFFDVCYIGWHNHSLYRFGISPNKIFDYMYAGKPIIHSVNTSNDFVQIAEAGISIPTENPKEITNAVSEISKIENKKLKEWGKNGKKYVEENHTFSHLTELLISTFE
jgi:glycosyltransferase involved in cell wall biosynthesis